MHIKISLPVQALSSGCSLQRQLLLYAVLHKPILNREQFKEDVTLKMTRN